MTNLIALFILSLSLIAGGSLVSKNPQSLEPIKQRILPTSGSKEEARVTMKRYSHQDPYYTFEYPDTWILQTDVPGCGPVWFVDSMKKAWLTVCGAYEGESASSIASRAASGEEGVVVKRDEMIGGLPAIRQEKINESGKMTEVYITTSKGVIAFYFTDLSQNPEHEALFDQLLSTLNLQ